MPEFDLFDPGPVIAVQNFLGHGWPLPWRIISLMGSSWGVMLVAGLALWLYDRRTMHGILAVVVIDGILKMLLNEVINVPRPDAPGLVKYETVDLGSFPSGHVATATVLWGWLAVRRHISWWLAGTVILLQAVSRLYLGVHYVSDVIGGALLAAIVILITLKVWPPVRDRLANRSFRFFAVAGALLFAGTIVSAFLWLGDNPYRWRAAGMTAGVGLALPLEYWFVRYRPATSGHVFHRVLIGFAGIGILAAVDQLTGESYDVLGFAMAATATLWALFIVPWIFARNGWGESRLSPSTASPPQSR